ncbi:matrixin family metalloprotease [Lacipirellula limnantheis]|uniref:Matrixin n=1 Tax=Lacipirellula limnantheis TaxID=2528024 RepID=A0A517U187_9BACT|nr:matrixin family metalloprotease [Lacipirellula limnantheis]QDT74396.1 Matrixin [Lacipirellula limnantheis]
MSPRFVSSLTTRYSCLAVACRCFVGYCALIAWSDVADAFYANGRWTTTATDAATTPAGFPVTLTWSIVADGASLSPGGSSNLISFFDGLYGSGGGGPDLSLRPWFGLVEQSFDRWTELSGLTFLYEPVDDGAVHGNFAGALGVRGDVRLAGKFLDGIGGTNAQAGFIPNADLTIDTGDSTYFGNSSNNYRALRNTLTHEIGHSLGLGHVDSNSAAFLMEGFSNNAFDGPQLDDVRGVQSLYGDKFERLAGAGGNGSIDQATPLGGINTGSSLTIGTHSATGTLVLPSEADFVSIANQSDVDYFSFTTVDPSLVDLTLTPRGVSYNERIGGSSSAYSTTNAAQLNDLSLELYALVNDVPTLLQSAGSQPLGAAESLVDVPLANPGEYFVRISGSGALTQLYELAIGVEPLAVTPPIAGDFDLDGDVDGADLLIWQRGAGAEYSTADLAAWQANFGGSGSAPGNAAFVATTVPEPTTWLVAAAAVPWLGLRRFRSASRKRPLRRRRIVKNGPIC